MDAKEVAEMVAAHIELDPKEAAVVKTEKLAQRNCHV